MTRFHAPLRWLLVALGAALFFLAPAHAADRPPSSDALECVLLTWDAAPAGHTQRLVEAGRLPRLAAFAAAGTRARFSQTAFPSKTAVGHASLFTGCFASGHGIVANQVPRGPDAQHDALDLASGFDPAQLTAETFWQACARQGKRTLVLQAPLAAVGPDYRDPSGGRLFLVNGYGSTASDYALVDGLHVKADERPWTSLPRHEGTPRMFSFVVGDSTVFGVVLDTVFDGQAKPDTVLLSTDRRHAITLRPTSKPSFSPPLLVHHAHEVAGAHFMLLSVGPAPDGFCLLRSSTAVERVNGVPVDPQYILETGGFVGNGPTGLYRQGKLGKPFYQGGDGTAETRYLAAVRFIADSFTRKARYWVARVQPQVVVAYLPYPDEALHTWLGVAGLPGRGPETWKHLETVFHLCDDFLGVFLAMASNRTLVALASDHGMAAVEKEFRPNVVLREAGLLAVDARGRIDLEHTRILYGMEDGTFLRVNRASYKHGVVPPDQERATIERAVAALSAARDPETGQAVVTGFYYPGVDAATFGIGGGRCGDVYLDLAPGVSFQPAPSGPAVARLQTPQGVHVFNPLREDMHAIFYARGPGIPAGRVVPAVRITQIVPTLCRLLGIAAPRQAQGQAVSF